MPDDTAPDSLTKTDEDDDGIKLTEADLNQVSGGAFDAFLKFADKTTPNRG